MEKSTTHFGFRTIPTSEKESLVGSVFRSVAQKYDLMNDLMSLGVHRLWKKMAVAQCGLKAHQTILDLAGGTGDLSLLMQGQDLPLNIILADINEAMLMVARDRFRDQGIVQGISFLQTNGESLSLGDRQLDCVIVGFGLRNMTHKEKALSEIYRVLKPGGRLVILEFSKPSTAMVQKAYDFYSFGIIPMVGKWVTQDKASYQYLVESIRKHPNQEELAEMLRVAQFNRVEYQNIHNGIVAIHKGFKDV